MIVRTSIRREQVSSTSDLARELVNGDDPAHPLPLLVRADRQTRGRGRGTNAWWSGPGSLTFTLAIDPRAHGLRPAHEPRLALAAAVAVVEAVGPGVPLGVRWPNDIEAGGRKVGGILPERVETPRGPRLLIGIGLNVRTLLADAPADVRALAATLSDWGDPRTPDEILADFLIRFAAVVPRLAADDPALAARWAELDTLRDRPVRVDLGPRVVTGVGRGIDPDGALILATAAGPLRLLGGRVLRD